jgi:predicted peptidase
MNYLYRSFLALGLSVVMAGCSKSSTDAPPEELQLLETQPPVLVPVNMSIHDKIGGFYLAHPARYNENSNTYPLLVFIHGGGQYGNGPAELPRVLQEGIPKLLAEKKFPPGFQVNGRQYSFIILAPQFRNTADNGSLQAVIDFAKSNYRVDTNRIYLVGFSLGGRAVCDYSASNPLGLSAFVTMAGVSSFGIPEKAKAIGQAGLHVWGFHNRPDQVFTWQDTRDFINQVNAYDPADRSRLTIFPDSTGAQFHDAWTKATDPAYRENGVNIYEWMLGWRR